MGVLVLHHLFKGCEKSANEGVCHAAVYDADGGVGPGPGETVDGVEQFEGEIYCFPEFHMDFCIYIEGQNLAHAAAEDIGSELYLFRGVCRIEADFVYGVFCPSAEDIAIGEGGLIDAEQFSVDRDRLEKEAGEETVGVEFI